MNIESKSCGDVEVKLEYQKEGYSEYLLIDDLGNIEESRTINCLINVGEKSLDPVPVTSRFLKTTVDYDYILEESIQIEVKAVEVPGIEDIVDRATACCEIITGSSRSAEIRYEWKETQDACESLSNENRKVSVVASNKCSE